MTTNTIATIRPRASTADGQTCRRTYRDDPGPATGRAARDDGPSNLPSAASRTDQLVDVDALASRNALDRPSVERASNRATVAELAST